MSDSCDTMDCSPLGSSVHGIFLARILEWVAISSSRGSSHSRIKPTSPVSPALQADFSPLSQQGSPPHIIYIYMCVCLCVCVCVYYVYVYIHIYVCIYMYIYMYVCVYIYVYVYAYMYVYVCMYMCVCICCWVPSVVSDSVRPHRRQSPRLPHPWDSPGKNTGVDCHCLLQCMKVKSENEVAQSCLTLSDPMDCSLPGSSIHGIFQARVLEWGAIAFSNIYTHTHTYRKCIAVPYTWNLHDNVNQLYLN